MIIHRFLNVHNTLSSLNDVVQSEGRLFLVFEFVDKDLKRYFDATEGMLSPQLVKVNSYRYFLNRVVTFFYSHTVGNCSEVYIIVT